ncbi:hypothetical protein AX17_004557 [Amanita inopinata Kibby_2008]|nr:hypothetical protein AX17_004557 [Amanita inopinata Kibby_2008]
MSCDLVFKLADLLAQPLESLEIIPGAFQDWAAQGARDDFPFALVDGHLGVPERVLYRLYMSSVSMFTRANAEPRNTVVIVASARVILLANPAHQTALNACKRLVLHGQLSAEAELRFTELLLRGSKECTKQSIVWNHRRWMFLHLYGIIQPASHDDLQELRGWLGPLEWDALPNIPADVVGRELELVRHGCELYPRNYHGWNHWRYMMNVVYVLLRLTKGGEEWQSLVVKEREAMERWVGVHVTDLTSRHHVKAFGESQQSMKYAKAVCLIFTLLLSTAAHDANNEQAAEGARAFRQAMNTLSSLTAIPPQRTPDPSIASMSTNPSLSSIFSSFLPNAQGQGPVASAVRIALKLHQYTIRRLSSGLGKDGLGIGTKRKDDELRGKAIKVVDLLQHSAELGNMDALFVLAKISLFPPTPQFNLDAKLAYDSFLMHTSATGNATSQSYLSFFYATGYHNVVPVDQAKGQLYYTFAANGGDKGAEMALAYRYWSGIGTQESCQRAMFWYEAAAEQAMAKFLSGPPGGRTLPQTATRLSDLAGGVYGPGASVASTGMNGHRPAIKAGIAQAAGETWYDVLEYYQFNADRGEIDFAYRLGKIHYQGSIYASPGGVASGSEGVGAVPRNYALALHYFSLIARQVWPNDPSNPLNYKPTSLKDNEGPVGYAAASAGYIGRMYLRGEGVKANPAVAKMWFERGAEHGDRECHNGLGIIYRDGLVPGVKLNLRQALIHFDIAAGQELAEAQVNVGKYHYSAGDIPLATTYFEAAVRHGSPFEAYYYLGQIHSSQAGNARLPSHLTSSSCAMAVSFYKLVSERGVWDDDLLRDAELDWVTGTDEGKELAMLKWWIAAERGSEIAQNNLAYVLDQDTSMLRLTRFSPITPSNDTARLALTQWTRAAAQRNIDALVKVGDYYYHGLGVSEDETESSRLEKAARYYQSAADTQVSALAMWNLGWMYENGIGMPQDFHLAKRHYDLALEANSEAYLPVMLSLAKLYARSIWYTLMGGKDGLSIWSGEDVDAPNPNEGRELEDGSKQGGSASIDTGKGDEDKYSDDDDGTWYLGKAKEDFHRRKNGKMLPDRQRMEEEDPIEWARERRDAERERDSDFGPEDYFEATLRGGNRELNADEDDFMDTMLLVLICLVISVLLYIRTRMVERMRREQQQRAAQAQRQRRDGSRTPTQAADGNGNGQNGFPPPGNPARDEWVIQR